MSRSNGWRLAAWAPLLAVTGVLALLGRPSGDGDGDGDAATATPESESPAPPTEVLWGGCQEVRLPDREGEPLTCIMTLATKVDAHPDALRVWLPTSVSDASAWFEQQPFGGPLDEAVDHEGWHFVGTPAYSGRFRVEGTVGGQRRDLLVLDVELRPRDGSLRRQLRAASGNPQAQAELEQRWRRELDRAQTPAERLELTRNLQYLLFDAGRGEESTVVALEVAAMARARGQPLGSCNAALAAAYLIGRERGRIDEALGVIETWCDRTAEIPEMAMWRAYHESVLHLSQGHLAALHEAANRSMDIARRLRWDRWERYFISPLVDGLAHQGRFDAARRWLDRVDDLADRSLDQGWFGQCESRVFPLKKRGELAMREAQLLGQPMAPAREHWERALAILIDPKVCPVDHNEMRLSWSSISDDLARVDIEEGRLDEAAARLEAIDAAILSPQLALRHRLVTAELELAQQAWPRARATLERLASDLEHGSLAEAAEAAEAEDRWRTYVALARLHLATDQSTSAIEALKSAEQALSDGATTAGMDRDTDRYLAMGRRSRQLLVRALLSQSQVGPAACVARSTRARGLVGPAPSSDHSHRAEGYEHYRIEDVPIDEWLARMTESPAAGEVATPGCSDLPGPAPGELSLMPFYDGERWLAFAWDDQGHVLVEPSDGLTEIDDPKALGALLLQPLDESLQRATRLRVIAPPELAAVDVAGLEWNGRRVGDAMAVVYGLDLRSPSRQGPAQREAAVVLSDPRGRLTTAVALPELLSRWTTRIEADGLPVTFAATTSSSRRVSLPDMLDGTESVELAILYGFGAHHPSRDERLWPEGVDPDVDASSFDLGVTGLWRSDVLTRPGRVPQRVILAHCDSARVDPYGIAGALGLSQSYVQAGSEWALGTSGTVEPTVMIEIVDEVLRAYAIDPNIDSIARAVSMIQRRLTAEGKADADRLRLWIR